MSSTFINCIVLPYSIQSYKHEISISSLNRISGQFQSWLRRNEFHFSNSKSFSQGSPGKWLIHPDLDILFRTRTAELITDKDADILNGLVGNFSDWKMDLLFFGLDNLSLSQLERSLYENHIMLGAVFFSYDTDYRIIVFVDCAFLVGVSYQKKASRTVTN